MASDDIQKRKELLAGERDLMNEIVKSAQTYKFVSNQAKDIKEDLLKNLAEEKDLTSKINDINTTIDELLKEQLDKGEDINQHYIDQLDNVRTILEQKQKQTEMNNVAETEPQWKHTLTHSHILTSPYVVTYVIVSTHTHQEQPQAEQKTKTKNKQLR